MDREQRAITILVVDDSLAIRRLLQQILQPRYAVLFARDGQEGLEVYEAERPDIIILDMNMPRKDGLEVIREIRTVRGDLDTFILFLTAEDWGGLRTRALNDGANDFLSKPMDHDELLARIGVATRQVQLNRSLRRALDSMDQEMDLVVSLQQKLLPDQSPCLPGMRIMSLYHPSGRASGDYYDYFPVAGDSLRVVMADVSGHGARAAFIMAIVRTLFRTTQTKFQDLRSTFAQVNQHLCQIIGKEMDFVTIFAADVNVVARRLEYVNAGHCPGLVRLGDRVERLGPTSPLLGFFEVDLSSVVIEMGPQAGLLLFTDGCYEWETRDGELLGLDRFCDLASGLMRGGGTVLDDLMLGLTSLSAESGDSDMAGFRDDVTALWIEMET